MFTDSEEESKINHHNNDPEKHNSNNWPEVNDLLDFAENLNNDPEKHNSNNWPEVNDLLDFAENLKVRCDKFLDRIFLLNILQIFFGFSMLGFSLVNFGLIPGLYLNINFLLVVLIYFGWLLLFLFIEASSKTLRLRVSTDRRVLNSTVDLLRENSSVLAQDWSNLQKIQLQIKLSIFDVNTSENPWLKLKNLFTENFFLWASGVNIDALNNAEAVNQKSKYKTIGFVIFSTTFFAFISSTYAFYTVFANEIVSAFSGLLLSFLIFSINRFMAMTIFVRNQERFNSPFFITTNIARLALVFLMASIISAPLELRIFQTEIENQIKINNQVVANSIAQNDNRIKQIDNQIKSLDLEIDSEKHAVEQLRQKLESELIGESSSGKKGYGPFASEINKIISTRINDLSKSIKSREILKLQKEERIEFLKNTSGSTKNVGLATKLTTMYQLYRKDPTIMAAGYSIRLMIIMIELLPFMMELLTKRSYKERLKG